MFAPEHLKRIRKVHTIISETKPFLKNFVSGQKVLTNTFCKILFL